MTVVALDTLTTSSLGQTLLHNMVIPHVNSSNTNPHRVLASDINVYNFSSLASFDPSLVPEGYLGGVFAEQYAVNSTLAPAHTPYEYDVVVFGNGSALLSEIATMAVIDSAIVCQRYGLPDMANCPMIDVSYEVLPKTEYEEAYQQIYEEILKATLAGMIVGFLMMISIPSQVTPILEDRVRGCFVLLRF